MQVWKGISRSEPHVSSRTIALSSERFVPKRARYVGKCVDCETGKGCPVLRGEYPEKRESYVSISDDCNGSYPSLPWSFKGNAKLLMRVGLFSGYVITKVSSSRPSKIIVEGCEECVLR